MRHSSQRPQYEEQHSGRRPHPKHSNPTRQPPNLWNSPSSDNEDKVTEVKTVRQAVQNSGESKPTPLRQLESDMPSVQDSVMSSRERDSDRPCGVLNSDNVTRSVEVQIREMRRKGEDCQLENQGAPCLSGSSKEKSANLTVNTSSGDSPKVISHDSSVNPSVQEGESGNSTVYASSGDLSKVISCDSSVNVSVHEERLGNSTVNASSGDPARVISGDSSVKVSVHEGKIQSENLQSNNHDQTPKLP